jgi:hypothetical protein
MRLNSAGLSTKIKKGELGVRREIEGATVSTSFWQQDINWSAHLQRWTRSFYQVNQNWTRELSGPSSPGPRPPPPQTDQSSSASIINPDALDIQI